MTIKITTPNGGADSLDFGCAQTAIVATVTGTEVSSGEGKLELKTTTGGTSATKATVLANGNVGIGESAPLDKAHIYEASNSALATQLLLQNEGSGNHTAGIAFQVSSSGETTAYAPKAGILFERSLANGRGDIKFMNDNVSDTNGFSAGDEAMRITSAGLLKFNSGFGSVATAYGCRAWVNFDGTGTVAIREDGNVSSITDNGTGDYTVNFAVDMPDINYAWSGGAWNSGGSGRAYVFINNSVSSALAVGSIRFRTGGTSDYDVATIALSVFR